MAWQDFKILGFAPDLPNTTPGALVQMVYVMPTDRGLGPAPVFNEQGSGSINSASMGGALVSKTDGTQRVFVGIADKLYETTNPPSGSPTDRSGGTYAATTSATWSFCQFGDVTLAVNKNDYLQYITGSSTAFAPVGTAPVPKASIIATGGPTSAPVVMAFDYNDGTDNFRDGWFASGLGDAITTTGWTTGTNSCANGRLLDDVPGPITAGIGFRDDFVAFKATGMYIGTYTGDATNPWSWRRISSDIGCIGKNALVRANDILYWADTAGIWMFDGSYPRLVPGNVHNYWASICVSDKLATAANRNYFRVVWDKAKHWLHVFSGTASGPTIREGMTWNSISELWTQHGGSAIGSQPFINAGGTAFARELIGPRLYVTNSLKLGAYTLVCTGTEPAAAIIDGWLITDFVRTPVLKGLRPHWRVYSGTTLAFGGSGYTDISSTFPPSGGFRRFRAPYEYTEIVNQAAELLVLSQRDFGKLDGQVGGGMVSWRLLPPAGIEWEIDGLTLDVEPHGKS